MSEVVIRPEDTIKTLKVKVRYATILGIIQSTYTDFQFLSREWKKNCDEERLLGVSLTGLRDHAVLGHKSREAELMLVEMKQEAIDTAKEWSEILGINMPAAITCTKPSGCRPWDAITTTKEGVLTLEEMLCDHEHGQEWADSGGKVVVGNGEFSNINKTYVNGIKKVLRVNLNYGVALDSTENHRWFVSGYKNGREITPINDWIRADEIVPGHIIQSEIGLYRNESSSPLVKFNPESIHTREDAVEVMQPDEMDEELAWFLGYLWGDGAMSPACYRIRFIDQNKYNLEKVARIAKDKFGINGDIKKASGARDAVCLDLSSKSLWHWLIKNKVWKYQSDKIDVIPEAVRRSSWRDIVAFLSGMYDADGWCGKNGKQTFTTASEMFSRHYQHVAMSVGLVFGRSKNVGGKNLQKQKEMYLMGLSCGCCHDAFNIFRKNSTKMANMEEKEGEINWDGLKDKKFVFGIVKSVESVGEQKTYDIETDCHWYMNGAFKSHNTVSQLVDSASGLHHRYSPYYIRRVRVTASDPLAKMLIDAGIPHNPEVGETVENPNTWVFDFPTKAPSGAVFRDEETAIQQLEYWLMLQRCWCEQKPSITTFVKDDEWLEVGNWVYKNWNYISGISFLPFDGGVYQLAPYEEISEEQYTELVSKMPEIDFDKLTEYEREDATQGSREFACQGNSCELA